MVASIANPMIFGQLGWPITIESKESNFELDLNDDSMKDQILKNKVRRRQFYPGKIREL